MKTREQFVAELKLRESLQKIIPNMFDKKLFEHKDKLLIENTLRKYIRKLINEAQKVAPHKATGLNILDTLLKTIIPVIEDYYKSLTSSINQRESFRAHIVNAALRTIQAVSGTDDDQEPEPVNEGIDVTVMDDDPSNDKPEDHPAFIPVERSSQKKDPDEEFGKGLEGKDKTGRNIALQCFKKVEKQIGDAYLVLDDEKDKEVFRKFLITNLKLWFDKFEDELKQSVNEPTTTEYEDEKDMTSNQPPPSMNQPPEQPPMEGEMPPPEEPVDMLANDEWEGKSEQNRMKTNEDL